jgi:hypothetical protein
LHTQEQPASAGQPVNLLLDVTDGTNGLPADDLVPDHDALMHLFVVSTDRGFFQHIHPARTASGRYLATFAPARPGVYTAYAEVLRTSTGPQVVARGFSVSGPATGPGSADMGDVSVAIQRADNGATLGVLGVILETGILMGILLWIVRRVSLPPGSLTLIFGLYRLLTMLATRIPIFLPIWLMAGILSDVAMVVLKPSSGDVSRFRIFGGVVPLLMWGVYYLFFIVTGTGGGIWFTGYIWTGSIVQAAIIGYLLAFLMTSSSEKETVGAVEPVEMERNLVGHTHVSAER